MSSPPKFRTPQEIEALSKVAINPARGEIIGAGGNIIGNYDKNGYVRFFIQSKNIRYEYKRSHAVWWAFTGEWPTHIIRHKDGNITNDVIDNLEMDREDQHGL